MAKRDDSKEEIARPRGRFKDERKDDPKPILISEEYLHSPEYLMNHQYKGRALIINNVDFSSSKIRKNRTFSNREALNLQNALENLGFGPIKLIQDGTKAEVLEEFSKISNTDHSDFDCFLCIILSYGNEDMIFVKDDETIRVKTIFDYFKADKCPSLILKPKIFIFSATIEESFKSSNMEPPDFLLCYSTSKGNHTWRNTLEGGWFLQSLYHETIEGDKLDLLSCLSNVIRKVAIEYSAYTSQSTFVGSKQIPTLKSTLKKELRITGSKPKPKFFSSKDKDSKFSADEDYDQEQYYMGRKQRGTGLVVLCNKFTHMPNRTGGEFEKEKIQHILQCFGIKFKTLIDPTRQEIIRQLQKIAEYDHTDKDCFVFVISSHAELHEKITIPGGQLETETVFITWDSMITEFEIMNFLGPENCPSLAFKPKILILQGSRAFPKDSFDVAVNKAFTLYPGIELEAKPRSIPNEFADFVYGFHSASDNDERRPSYIQFFISELEKMTEGTNFLDLMTRMNSQMLKSGEQDSRCFYETSLTKKLRLAGTKSIPSEIIEMGEEAINIYVSALEEGKVKIHNLRLMFVGPAKVGKTELSNRVLGDSTNVKPNDRTDGIDVHVRKCVISEDGTWLYNQDLVDKVCSPYRKMAKCRSIIAQISSESKTMPEHHHTKTKLPDHPKTVKKKDNDEDVSQSTTIESLSIGEEEEGAENTSRNETPFLFEHHYTEHHHIETKSVRQISKDNPIFEILKKVEQELKTISNDDWKKYIEVSLWDFAGQFVYYYTHQVFLTNRAIYVLVLNINKALNDLVTSEKCAMDVFGRRMFKLQEYVVRWLKNIYTYGRSSGRFPPFFVVASHVDELRKKCTSDIDLEMKKEEFFTAIKDFVGNHFGILPDKSFAIVCTEFGPEIENLKKDIFRKFEDFEGKGFWGEEIPFKWVLLETALNEIKMSDTSKKIMQLSEVEELGKIAEIQTEGEIIYFLKFQHALGNLIFFDEENLRDYVVLYPQWLIDAFKCIITSKEIYKNNDPQEYIKLQDFKRRGLLKDELFSILWKDFDPDIRNHIARLMQHLDIIVKPTGNVREDNSNTRDCYYVPCLFQEEITIQKIQDLYENEEYNTKTPYLCYNLQDHFLPAFTFHRLIAACIKQWNIAETSEGKPQVFSGCGIFEHPDNEACCVVVNNVESIIQARVISIDNEISEVCRSVRTFLDTTIRGILKLEDSSLKEKMYIKCPDANDFETTGLISVTDLQKKKKLCKGHKTRGKHKIDPLDLLKYWFPDMNQDNLDTKDFCDDIQGRQTHQCQSQQFDVRPKQYGSKEATLVQSKQVSQTYSRHSYSANNSPDRQMEDVINLSKNQVHGINQTNAVPCEPTSIKDRIRYNFEYLVNNIDCLDMLDTYLSREIINLPKYDAVKALSTPNERNRLFLLEVILRGSDGTCKTFIEDLRLLDEQIAERIEQSKLGIETEGSDVQRGMLKDQVRQHTNILIEGPNLESVADRLYSNRILELLEYENIYAQTTSSAKNVALLQTLQKKDEKGVEILLNMLRGELHRTDLYEIIIHSDIKIEKISGEHYSRPYDSTITMDKSELLNREKGKIGLIREHYQNEQGTGFRVGTEYVMSAFHIFENVIDKIWDQIGLLLWRHGMVQQLCVYLDVVYTEKKGNIIPEILKRWRKQKSPSHTIEDFKRILQEKGESDKVEEICSKISEIWNAEIVFSYYENVKQPKSFKFEPEIPFYDEAHDIIILKLSLSEEEKIILPPVQLVRPDAALQTKMHLIGHPKGNKLTIDPSCTVYHSDQLQQAIEPAKKICKENVEETDYEIIESQYNDLLSCTDFAVFDCSKIDLHGASGSPAFVFESEDSWPSVQMILQEGCPYLLKQPKMEKITEDHKLLFERGIQMKTLYSLLSEPKLADLRDDVFRQVIFSKRQKDGQSQEKPVYQVTYNYFNISQCKNVNVGPNSTIINTEGTSESSFDDQDPPVPTSGPE